MYVRKSVCFDFRKHRVCVIQNFLIGTIVYFQFIALEYAAGLQCVQWVGTAGSELDYRLRSVTVDLQLGFVFEAVFQGENELKDGIVLNFVCDQELGVQIAGFLQIVQILIAEHDFQR